jgi:hypothetical protein
MRVITRIAKTFTTANFWLWTVQVLLAALYLFSGGFKAFAPMSLMQMPVALPEWFVRFLGYAELAGALGLILPTLLRIQPRLTPIAASCLVVIMTGATVITAAYVSVPMAIMPVVLGLLNTYIAYGRVRLAPVSPRRAARRLAVAHAQAA